jgi:cytochrome c oxidase subunit IV
MANTAHADNNNAGKREVWKVTIILSVLTLVELGLGFMMIGMEQGFLTTLLKGIIIILMLAKAFYIVAYFMHLGHELRNLIMTIVVPLGLFIWFIIAFLYDGASYGHLKNTYDPAYKERSTQKTNAGSEPVKHDMKDVQAQPKPVQSGESH